MSKLHDRITAVVLSITFCVVTGLLPASACAAEQLQYPVRPIRLIVPYAPGGTNDILARIVAPHIADGLQQQIVVDNRAGAEGNVGIEIAARAAPDGYTVVLINARLAGARVFNKDVKYDLVRDFAPVGEIATGESVMVARSGLPADSVADFIKLARAKPGQFTLAGTATTYPVELFRQLAKIEVTIVPYKGFATVASDIISGRVDITIGSVNDVVPQVRAGRLKALGIAGTKTVPQLPGVPPVADTLPGFDVGMFYGLSVPAKTPRAVVGRLNDEFRRVLARAEVQRQLETAYVQTSSLPNDQFVEKIRAEIAKWERFASETNLVPR